VWSSDEVLGNLACDICRAKPTEMSLASSAGHVIASCCQFDWSLALGAPFELSKVNLLELVEV
jgi:hypothetical protein